MRGNIVNGEFLTPTCVFYQDEFVENPSDEILEELGYPELVEDECPGENYEPYFEEVECVPYKRWKHVEKSITAEDRLSALESAMLEMMGVTIDD